MILKIISVVFETFENIVIENKSNKRAKASTWHIVFDLANTEGSPLPLPSPTPPTTAFSKAKTPVS